MLDAVVEYLPSPLDVGAIARHPAGRCDPGRARSPTRRRTFSGLAFKVATDPHLGKLTFVRVYSGTLELRHPGRQRDQGPQGADRQDLPDARQQA